jgi:hypothetical protein
MNKQLLSINADAKTIKGQKIGVLTGIMYFAPAKISGYQVCAFAKIAQCENACLYTAGRGGFNSVQKARINKTKRFFEDREAFFNDLVYSIKAVINKANKLGLKPAIRLNGTSDLLWEKESFIYKGQFYNNIMEFFPNTAFYDYTKYFNRDNLPANYDLTFSYSNVESFQKYNKLARLNSALSRIAVVFRSADVIPAQFLDLPVINGDETDVRFMDDKNVIIGLYAKGKGRKDNSGFIVDKV